MLEFKGDLEYFTSTNIVAADGYSQSNNILAVSGLGDARINHNAILCLFALNQNIVLYPYKKAFNNLQNL